MSQKDVDAMKEAFIRMKNQTKTLGVAKTTFWYTLKMMECTVELNNTKKPGIP